MIITKPAANGLNWLGDKPYLDLAKTLGNHLDSVNKVVWKNSEKLSNSAVLTGAVATIGATILGYFNVTSASMFIGGSALLTGTLAFTAYQITYNIVNHLTGKYDVKLTWLPMVTGIAATGTMLYMASVPLVIAIGLTTLGVLASQTTVEDDNLKQFCNNLFKAVEAGFIYSLVSKSFNWIRPGLTVGAGSAVKTGLIMMGALVVTKYFTPKDSDKGIKLRIFGISKTSYTQIFVGIAAAGVASYFSPVAVVHQLMIASLCVAESRLK